MPATLRDLVFGTLSDSGGQRYEDSVDSALQQAARDILLLPLKDEHLRSASVSTPFTVSTNSEITVPEDSLRITGGSILSFPVVRIIDPYTRFDPNDTMRRPTPATPHFMVQGSSIIVLPRGTFKRKPGTLYYISSGVLPENLPVIFHNAIVLRAASEIAKNNHLYGEGMQLSARWQEAMAISFGLSMGESKRESK